MKKQIRNRSVNELEKIEILKSYIKTKDIYLMKEIYPNELVITDEVRDACIKNKCGQYGNNFMCPPYVGEVEDFLNKSKEYERGFLVLVKDEIDNPSDMDEFYKSATYLHEIMLDIEDKGKELGFKKATALIGGNCKLCKPCNAKLGKKECLHPKQARTSLEAVGIDVIATCKSQEIFIEFKNDEVTWVGLLLL